MAHQGLHDFGSQVGPVQKLGQRPVNGRSLQPAHNLHQVARRLTLGVCQRLEQPPRAFRVNRAPDEVGDVGPFVVLFLVPVVHTCQGLRDRRRGGGRTGIR